MDRETENSPLKKVTRIGVYGACFKDGKILLIKQQRGPYAGKFDLPGGGVEFGESPEKTLRREFAEEVAMGFEECMLVDNMTAIINVPKSKEKEPYIFYQIGMIYEVKDFYPLEGDEQAEFEHLWTDLNSLVEVECSSFLWKYRNRL